MADDTRFYEIEPTLENYWRAVILFGKNCVFRPKPTGIPI
jgi:hypothetical protein